MWSLFGGPVSYSLHSLKEALEGIVQGSGTGVVEGDKGVWTSSREDFTLNPKPRL